MHDKDDLDLLLDAAIGTYADDSTPSGLEARVVARIAGAGGSARQVWWSRRRWFPWGLAVQAAACILIFLTALWWRAVKAPKSDATRNAIPTYSTDQPSRVTAQSKPLAASNSTDTHRDLARAPSLQPHRHNVAKSIPLPKLDVFPTPEPLSPEEQALVAFATHVPPEQRKALLDEQQNDNAPLSIAAIKITPLSLPDPDQDKN